MNCFGTEYIFSIDAFFPHFLFVNHSGFFLLIKDKIYFYKEVCSDLKKKYYCCFAKLLRIKVMESIGRCVERDFIFR